MIFSFFPKRTCHSNVYTRKGKALGLDYTQTWSCYKGGEIHCGKCGTCRERKEALADAGITDLTQYED